MRPTLRPQAGKQNRGSRADSRARRTERHPAPVTIATLSVSRSPLCIHSPACFTSLGRRSLRSRRRAAVGIASWKSVDRLGVRENLLPQRPNAIGDDIQGIQVKPPRFSRVLSQHQLGLTDRHPNRAKRSAQVFPSSQPSMTQPSWCGIVNPNHRHFSHADLVSCIDLLAREDRGPKETLLREIL